MRPAAIRVRCGSDLNRILPARAQRANDVQTVCVHIAPNSTSNNKQASEQAGKRTSTIVAAPRLQRRA
eukprot:11164686-Lingulodinium_polyedra.AAC.1